MRSVKSYVVRVIDLIDRNSYGINVMFTFLWLYLFIFLADSFTSKAISLLMIVYNLNRIRGELK